MRRKNSKLAKKLKTAPTKLTKIVGAKKSRTVKVLQQIKRAKPLKRSNKPSQTLQDSDTNTSSLNQTGLVGKNIDMEEPPRRAIKRSIPSSANIPQFVKRNLVGEPIVPVIPPPRMRASQRELNQVWAAKKAKRVLKHAEKKDKLVLMPSPSPPPSPTSPQKSKDTNNKPGIKRKKDAMKLADKVIKVKKIATVVRKQINK